MIADVGSAYLNAHMPQNDPKKFVFMMIAPNVAQIIYEVDPSFIEFRRYDGSLLVRLNKAVRTYPNGVVTDNKYAPLFT